MLTKEKTEGILTKQGISVAMTPDSRREKKF